MSEHIQDSLPDVVASPVFVDDSGRRRRRAHRVARVVGLCLVGYLTLAAASFARAPWLTHLSLPGIGSIVPPNANELPPAFGESALSRVVVATAEPAPPPGEGATPNPPPGGTVRAAAPKKTPIPAVKSPELASAGSTNPATTIPTNEPPPPDTTTTTTGSPLLATTPTTARPGPHDTATTPATTPATSVGSSDEPPTTSTAPPQDAHANGNGNGPPGGTPPGQARKADGSVKGPKTTTTTTAPELP